MAKIPTLDGRADMLRPSLAIRLFALILVVIGSSSHVGSTTGLASTPSVYSFPTLTPVKCEAAEHAADEMVAGFDHDRRLVRRTHTARCSALWPPPTHAFTSM